MNIETKDPEATWRYTTITPICSICHDRIMDLYYECKPDLPHSPKYEICSHCFYEMRENYKKKKGISL